jgi:hypothetical protein
MQPKYRFVFCKYFIVGVLLVEVTVYRAQVKYFQYSVWLDGRVDGWKDTYKMHTTTRLVVFICFFISLISNRELSTGERGALSVAEQQLMLSALRRAMLSTAERGASSVAEQQMMSSALRRAVLSTGEWGATSVAEQPSMSSALRHAIPSTAERDPSSVAEQQLMSSALRHAFQH